MVKELLATTDELQNPIDTLLNKFILRKTLRILSWKVSGPLAADKVSVQRKFFIKREQNLYSIRKSLKLIDNS